MSETIGCGGHEKGATEGIFCGLRDLPFGKRIHDAVYIHKSAVGGLPEGARTAIIEATTLAAVCDGDFDVVKLSLRERRLSLLTYPGFFTEAFPALAASTSIDLTTGTVSFREYSRTDNPPVLHRKEEMLLADHPASSELVELTATAEASGLFDDPGAIGFLVQWEETLRSRGVRVEGLRLVATQDCLPTAGGESAAPGSASPVLRHRTAIQRRALSTPIQALARHGYLGRGWSVLDYGCGRGDDVALLRQQGVQAQGWDPYFAPDEPLIEAEIVNLGFVLNVIEDGNERRAALSKAYSLARRVLAVAVLIGGRTAYERQRLFRDGVLTARGTFQKYFTQDELRAYLEHELGREPIPVTPGTFFVFRTDQDEQVFLAERQHCRNQRSLKPSPSRLPSVPRPVLALRPRQRRVAGASRTRSVWKAPENQEVLEALWSNCLALGRVPAVEEFPRMGELLAIGTLGRTLRHLANEKGGEAMEAARKERTGDLLVYLALNLFERRRSFHSLPESIQRDIKAFCGTAKAAHEQATALLYSIGRPEVIETACKEAAATGLGLLDPGSSLRLHSSLAGRLPPVLRVYLGAAVRLFGEVETADVIKLHTRSGKVTLLLYDDFEGKPLPVLQERIKVDLRHQKVVYIDHGSDPTSLQVLFQKSRLITADFPHYEEQVAFDRRFVEMGLFDFSGFGPDLQTVSSVLTEHGLAIEGFHLTS